MRFQEIGGWFTIECDKAALIRGRVVARTGAAVANDGDAFSEFGKTLVSMERFGRGDA
jgi:hypothetical protein